MFFVDVNISIRLDLARLVVTCSNIQASIHSFIDTRTTYIYVTAKYGQIYARRVLSNIVDWTEKYPANNLGRIGK